MSDEAGIRQFRLFGEDAPGWFVWGLALLGLAGFVVTAQLLEPLLEKELIPRFLEQVAGSGGSQGQPHPTHRPDANVLVDREPMEDRMPVPVSGPDPDKPGLEDPVVSPARSAESELDSMPSEMKAVLSPDAMNSDSLVSQDSPPPSRVSAESLGTLPDIPVELRPPSPLLETSASGEILYGPIGADSEHDQEVAPDTAIDQLTGGNGRDPSSATEVLLLLRRVQGRHDHTDLASDGGSEKATAVAASTDQADDGSGECAPVFIVTFLSGGVEPLESDLASKVKRLADWLRRHPTAKVYLEGHTDGLGDEEFNLVLSHRRAKAIAMLLVQAGVPIAQLSTRAYGEGMLSDPRPYSGRNRRVSMRVMNGNECLPKARDHEG